jgi:hypothetical protein
VRRRALVAIVFVVLTACREKRDDRADELRARLATIRSAIARYHADTGGHPESLHSLVPKYLPAVPVDPVTGSTTTWRFTTEVTVAPNTDFTKTDPGTSRPVITDVHSGAGAPWSDY